MINTDKKLIKMVDEDTIQKMSDNYVIDEEAYPFAIGYCPKTDLIVFYNYDEMYAVATCKGEDFLKDHTNLTNEFLKMLEIYPIGVLNKEEIEDYEKAYELSYFELDDEDEEINYKIEKAERNLKSANLEILSYFDLEQLEEVIEQSLERYKTAQNLNEDGITIEYEENMKNLKGIDEDTIKELGQGLYIGFNPETKVYVIYEDVGGEQKVLETAHKFKTLDKDVQEFLERHRGEDSGSRDIGR